MKCINIQVEAKYELLVQELLIYLRKTDRLRRKIKPLRIKMEDSTISEVERKEMLRLLDKCDGAVVKFEEKLGKGKFFSAIIEAQVASFKEIAKEREKLKKKAKE